jgi:Domain of unknown function (DUF4296)
MQKYKSLFFSLFLFVYACSGNKAPKGTIDTATMVGLLTEVHIADGSMYNTVQVPDSLYKYGTARYIKVFQNFHIDSAEFRKSMQYYANNPELLTKIYEQVSVNLSKKMDSLNKANQKQIAIDNKRRTDSLKKLPKTQQIQARPVIKPAINQPGQSLPFVNKRYLPSKHKINAHPIK